VSFSKFHEQAMHDLLRTSSRGCHEDAARKNASVEFKLIYTLMCSSYRCCYFTSQLASPHVPGVRSLTSRMSYIWRSCVVVWPIDDHYQLETTNDIMIYCSVPLMAGRIWLPVMSPCFFRSSAARGIDLVHSVRLCDQSERAKIARSIPFVCMLHKIFIVRNLTRIWEFEAHAWYKFVDKLLVSVRSLRVCVFLSFSLIILLNPPVRYSLLPLSVCLSRAGFYLKNRRSWKVRSRQKCCLCNWRWTFDARRPNFIAIWSRKATVLFGSCG